MNDEVQVAEREYERLLGKLPRFGSSEAVSRRNGIEAQYAGAYQRLVRLGARQQIRGKYRRA
jgi:hypothetical protein